MSIFNPDPFDANRSVKGCSCGSHTSQAEHDASVPDIETLHARTIQAAALAAHRALGVEVYSRVDVLLDADENPFVLEVNTIPGMTSSSLLPKAARAVGIEFPELCSRIIDLSLAIQR